MISFFFMSKTYLKYLEDSIPSSSPPVRMTLFYETKNLMFVSCIALTILTSITTSEFPLIPLITPLEPGRPQARSEFV
jgi:hypothetical protein